jgi:hypothetical protein
MTNGLDFIVDKKDWHQHRFVDAGPCPEPADGEIVFRVDRFAFTANNVSYMLAGEALKYWDFFDAGAEGMGRVPTMGFGDVIASKHEGVAVGTRCFGFFPMSRYLVIEPSAASPQQIVAHREGIAPVYNQYSPVDHDAIYTPETEDQIMLMRGLFMTSFLAEDFLDDAGHGEQAVLISSASSKTSIALAYCVKQRGRAKAVGLTSPRNLDFVKGLGFYDQVLLYDEVASLPTDVPVAFVDMAGNAALTRALHEHVGAQMKASVKVGATHHDAGGPDTGLPGAQPEFFFAPGQIQKRAQEWGPAALQERLGASWEGFCAASDAWLKVKRAYGRDAVERVYEETLDGKAQPADGHVISLWDDEASASGR